MSGFRFFLIHAPCPTGWKTEPADSIELVRLAVCSGIFPLYEVFNGTDYRINLEPDGTNPEKYFEKQKRFQGQGADLEKTKLAVTARIERLRKLAGISQMDKGVSAYSIIKPPE